MKYGESQKCLIKGEKENRGRPPTELELFPVHPEKKEFPHTYWLDN
jgi:hypothetical protein